MIILTSQDTGFHVSCNNLRISTLYLWVSNRQIKIISFFIGWSKTSGMGSGVDVKVILVSWISGWVKYLNKRLYFHAYLFRKRIKNGQSICWKAGIGSPRSRNISKNLFSVAILNFPKKPGKRFSVPYFWPNLNTRRLEF